MGQEDMWFQHLQVGRASQIVVSNTPNITFRPRCTFLILSSPQARATIPPAHPKDQPHRNRANLRLPSPVSVHRRRKPNERNVDRSSRSSSEYDGASTYRSRERIELPPLAAISGISSPSIFTTPSNLWSSSSSPPGQHLLPGYSPLPVCTRFCGWRNFWCSRC